MEALYAFCYALGIVPTFQWTYRAGRGDDYVRFDGAALLFASLMAALWFLVVPVGYLYKAVNR